MCGRGLVYSIKEVYYILSARDTCKRHSPNQSERRAYQNPKSQKYLFALSPQEMPDIDPSVAYRKLDLNPGARYVS